MSQLLIQHYLNELEKLRRVSGTHRESVVREAFKDLLKAWGRSVNLIFVPEYEYTTLTKDRRYVDGALLHALRVSESKTGRLDLDLPGRDEGNPAVFYTRDRIASTLVTQQGLANSRPCGFYQRAGIKAKFAVLLPLGFSP